MAGDAPVGQSLNEMREFLDRHLPSGGHRCIAHHSEDGFRASFWPDNRRATAKGVALNESGRGEVYFGCASYADPELGRKGPNVAAVRSCWLDIDTRESKKDAPYADKHEAKVALAGFCCKVGLSAPTVIDSGNGLHVYWPLDTDIAPDEWRRFANLLKWAALKSGLKVDPSRTTDIASVLRLPGTTNRKDSARHRPVRILGIGQPTNQSEFYATLVVFAGTEAAVGGLFPTHSGLGSNLMTSPNFRPSSAYRIAEHCAVIRHVRDTRGNVPEPLWHSVLGVLIHTLEGEPVCHDWSKGHPNYNQAETQSKIERLKNYRPTSCIRLCSLSGGLCDGCSYWANA